MAKRPRLISIKRAYALTSFSLKSELARTAEAVELALAEFLPRVTGQQSQVAEAMRYAALGGGKRLRPFLMVQSAALFNVPQAQVMPAAVALESLHVYSLVHDDLPCMDDDDIRRGKPTVHKAYSEAMAVLAGDGLLTHAFEILSDPRTHEDAAIRLELIAGLAKAGGVFGMIGGQVIDMTVSEQERDETVITQLQRLKTGALIEYAVEAGAILGRATEEERTALRHYAQDLGLAFQIKDDILDCEGDAQLMGKAAQKDADLGKATFVSVLGLEGAKLRAQDIGQSAKNHLQRFGARADLLGQTVDFVLHRDH